MNKEIFEKICQDVTENVALSDSQEQNEVNFLDGVFRRVAKPTMYSLTIFFH
jgi:hypothetical protein